MSASALLFNAMIVSTLTLVAFFTMTPTSATEAEKMRAETQKNIIIEPAVRLPRAAPDSYSLTPTRRTNRSIDISLMIVYKHETPLEKYATALNSVECYAKLHAYPLHVFSDAKYRECAKHKDLFFRRHCSTVRYMEEELKADSWLLLLDADIAVINPNKLVEHYIDPRYDITLFDRFFNFEVGANSYLVKNTKLGREFVQRFADYEFRLPKSFHGTDNGALHPFLVEFLVPEKVLLTSLCTEIWQKSTCYATLFEMEACTRMIFGDRVNFLEHKLRILPKGKAWVRDLWLLKSRWADDDFMVHGVKEKTLEKNRNESKKLLDNDLYQWDPMEKVLRTFPLTRRLNIAKCERGEEQWHYHSRLKIPNKKKAKLLDYMETKILRKRLEAIGRIAQRL